jgi:hypothetical protein
VSCLGRLLQPAQLVTPHSDPPDCLCGARSERVQWQRRFKHTQAVAFLLVLLFHSLLAHIPVCSSAPIDVRQRHLSPLLQPQAQANSNGPAFPRSTRSWPMLSNRDYDVLPLARASSSPPVRLLPPRSVFVPDKVSLNISSQSRQTKVFEKRRPHYPLVPKSR